MYATVLSSLRRAGLLYPCRCSRRLLADLSAPHGSFPVYPGVCRHQQRGWGWQQGHLPSWRLRLPAGELRWSERFSTPGVVDGTTAVGDVVLRRADGFMAYHLATAVDELRHGITDVLRGNDLWSSTAPQVAVMQLLGASPPRYGHLPLSRDELGQRLSKRDGSQGIEHFRARGLDAAAVVGELAASAGLVPPRSRLSAEELRQQLSLEGFEAAMKTAAQQDQQRAAGPVEA